MKLLFCLLLLSVQCSSQSYSIYNKGNLTIYDDYTDTGRCCTIKNGSYKCTVNLDKQHMQWKNLDCLWANSQYACISIFTDQSLQSLLFIPLNSAHNVQYFSENKRAIIATDSINNNICYAGKMTDDSVQVIFRNLLTGKRKNINLKREYIFWPGFDSGLMKMQHDKASIKSSGKTTSVDLKGLY